MSEAMIHRISLTAEQADALCYALFVQDVDCIEISAPGVELRLTIYADGTIHGTGELEP